jgi:hypothetical protein
MKRTILSCFAFFVTAGLAFAQNDSEWVPLFNGKDLSGWSVKCKPADRGKQFWRVEEGTIVADSLGHKDHDYVWLASDAEYSDFVLRLKFQAYRESPGNSGVQIRSRYDQTEWWLNGPQIDIHPPGPWRTGMMWDETRGNQRWIYPDIPKDQWVDESMSKPALQLFYADEGDGWNTLEIRAIGTKIEAVLNGVTVTDYDGAGILDDENHRARQVGIKGIIALQIHSGDELKIRFRDVEIKNLVGEAAQH